MKYLTSSIALLSIAFSSMASASLISVGNVRFKDTDIQYPDESTFYINYYLFGSQLYNPADSWVDFYLTQDDGQTGFPLASGSAGVRCSQSNYITTCLGASGQQTLTVGANLDYDTRQVLSSLCEPVTFKALAKFNLSSALSLNQANIGTIKPADWLISSGQITPNVVAAGGTVKIEASTITNCKARQTTASTLGVYLTDLNNNPLIYFGEGALTMPNGGNMTITLQIPSFMTAGNYRVFLIADHNQASDESNEGNNQAYADLTITAAGAVANAKQKNSINTSGYTSYLDRIEADQNLYLGSGMYEEKGIQFKQGQQQAAQTLEDVFGPAQPLSDSDVK